VGGRAQPHKECGRMQGTCRDCGGSGRGSGGVGVLLSSGYYRSSKRKGWLASDRRHLHRHTCGEPPTPRHDVSVSRQCQCLRESGHEQPSPSPPAQCDKNRAFSLLCRSFNNHLIAVNRAAVCRNRTCLLYIGQRRARFTISENRSRQPTTRQSNF
jgi:hypothetical protein